MKKQVASRPSRRSGFTLIELIVVLGIVMIVFAGIFAVFDFVNRTYLNSDNRSTVQFETRYAMEQLKRAVGTASEATIHETMPTVWPPAAGYGYAYFNTTTRTLRIRMPSNTGTAAAEQIYLTRIDNSDQLIGTQPARVTFVPVFRPVATPIPNPTLSPVAKVVRVTITVGNYTLASDVFVQNLPLDDTTVLLNPTTTTSGIVIVFR